MLGDSTLVKNGHSSLSLQVFVFFNWHFMFFFFILNVCLYTYKGSPASWIHACCNPFSAILFYYPARLLGWEFVTVFLYVLVESTRLLLGEFGGISLDSFSPFHFHSLYSQFQRVTKPIKWHRLQDRGLWLLLWSFYMRTISNSKPMCEWTNFLACFFIWQLIFLLSVGWK